MPSWDALFDFLFTYHIRFPRGSAYGWVYVLAAALPVLGGWQVWREHHPTHLPSRAQRLRQRWNFGPAVAHVLAHQQQEVWHVNAHFHCKQGLFKLQLHQYNHWQSQSESHIFHEWSDMADHLERHTPVRLTDFQLAPCAE